MVKELHKKVDKLHDKIDALKKSAQDWEKGAENKIKEHPVQSVLVSFGAGLLAGAVVAALMRRR